MRKLSIRKAKGTRTRAASPETFNVFVRSRSYTDPTDVSEREAGFIAPRRPRKDGTGGYRVQVWSSVFGSGGNYRADSVEQARQMFKDLFKGGRI